MITVQDRIEVASSDLPRLEQLFRKRYRPAAEQRGLSDGIKRTAFFRLLPDVDAAVARRFEQDLLAMPAHIPEILNWRLSRAQTLPWNVSKCAPWAYIWEQEFESLEGLTGPYMTNPHHWAHIDRWFDPESGVQAIDTDLSHAFSPFDESVLTREMSPDKA